MIELTETFDIKDLSDMVHDTNYNPFTNTIYLVGEAGGEEEPGIEYDMASRFLRNIDLAACLRPNDPLAIQMKTCGGDVYEGMAIYDAIKAYKRHVTITNWVGASSMSSLVLLAGDFRVMMPHSHYMFHDGSTVFEGTMKQYASDSTWMKTLDMQATDIYLSALRGGERGIYDDNANRRWLRSQMDKKEEVYLTAQQAVKLGFADEVWSPAP